MCENKCECKEKEESAVMMIPFGQLMELTKLASEHDAVVAYLESRKGQYVDRYTIAGILLNNSFSDYSNDIKVPLPFDVAYDLITKAERVACAARYLSHGMQDGEYLDSDAIYCIFCIEIPKKESEVEKND